MVKNKLFIKLESLLIDKTFLLIASVCLLVYHLCTLSISPLPWFDEVFFVDLSLSLKNSGELITSVTPLYLNKEPINLYGPLYYLIQSVIISLFGLSSLSFRMLNLCSSVLIFLIVKRWMGKKQELVKTLLIWILISCPIFIQNSHSGRMDLLATLFVLYAFFTLFRTEELSFKKTLSVALLLSMAILTTPRVMFLTAGLGVFYLQLIVRNHSKALSAIFHCLFIFGLPVLAYCTWSYISSGSFGYLIDNLLHNPDNKGFVGAGVFKKNVDEIIFIVFCGLYGLVKLGDRKITDVATALFLSCLIFRIFIVEVGPYGAMRIPFEILGIYELVIITKKQLLKEYTIGALYSASVFFLLIFGFKSISIFTHLAERNPNSVKFLLEKHRIKNKVVLSSFPYYYELKKKENLVFNYEEKKIRQMKSHLSVIDSLGVDYLLVLSKDTSNIIVKELATNGSFELTDSIIVPRSSQYTRIQKLFTNNKGYNSYEGYLYKRKL